MIPPKEKAKELIDKFKPLVFYNTKSFNVWQRKQIEENAKQCASIAVNLHLEEFLKLRLCLLILYRTYHFLLLFYQL